MIRKASIEDIDTLISLRIGLPREVGKIKEQSDINDLEKQIG